MTAHGSNRRHAALGAIAALAISAATSLTAWADTEVRVIATGEPYGNAMKKAAEIYKERTGVTVTIDQYPYSEAYNKEVLLGTTGSDEYDIMVLDCIWLPLFVKNNWVQPFDPLEAAAKQKIDWNGFLPGIVDAYDRFNGQYYAAPIDFFIEVMAYRADLFEAAGLSEAPKTWDEFRAYAEKLNQPDKGIYGVVTMPGEQDAGYSEWTVRLASLQMPLVPFVLAAEEIVGLEPGFVRVAAHGENRSPPSRSIRCSPDVAPRRVHLGAPAETRADDIT